MNISFEYPFFLILLPLGICFFKCSRESMELFFPKVEFLPKFSFKTSYFLQFLIFSLLVLALSAPFSYKNFISNPKKGRDLVLAIDASGSMDERFAKSNKSKFQTVIQMAKDFVKKRFDDNIGIVIFGSFAYIASPITYDMKALEFILNYLESGVAGNNTAIGDAIFWAVKALKSEKSKEKVIILLTDGHQNSGGISIKKAVLEAKKIKAKIYTLAIGDADKKLLKKIAKKSKGKFFYVKDKESLQKVFKEIDSLEPSKIRSGFYEDKKYLFPIFLIFSLFLIFYLLLRKIR